MGEVLLGIGLIAVATLVTVKLHARSHARWTIREALLVWVSLTLGLFIVAGLVRYAITALKALSDW